ncbi:nmrA-like family domain-containing protein 1 [Hyla sarda]|uniref:nmrA-like family domain-containing protein 1 n=1 Tax=Hyla sarda TaxID=327740 RepID=UPI0024C3A087|nr:nmrA-like family domain-containing protein 1 [Hyla sarda]
MAAKKIVTVFGATGAQGGSVASALLKDGTFAVRAVTRDITKPAALKLKEAGAEVVSADLDNKKSLEAALSGAYGAFVVTSFWDHFSKDKEVQQGKDIVDLCKRLGLQHVVYSGLENVNKLTKGKLDVLHFDGKGEVEEYFRDKSCPMTSVRLSFYFENFLTNGKPQKAKDGKSYELVIPMCDVPMDGFSVSDLGPAVLSILKSPKDYIGKDIGLSAEKLTVAQYAEIMSKVSGKTITDPKIPPEVYEKLPFPGAEEMANMFKFYQMVPDRDVALTHKLNPHTKKFKQWLEDNKEAFNKDL